MAFQKSPKLCITGALCDNAFCPTVSPLKHINNDKILEGYYHAN